MSLVSHALRELQEVIEDEDLVMCYIEIVSAFEAKANERLDPDILATLFKRHHLGQLTNNSREWHKLDDAHWQSLRDERAISDDAGLTYWLVTDDPPERRVSAQPTEKGEVTW
jgi:hypothetical protein